MIAKCVMVLGTTSGAGKSWLTTALCRYYARQGLKVAPFKAQNMSNNARVVGPHASPALQSLPPEGAAFGPRTDSDESVREGKARRPNLGGSGEIGSAQYFQALAARAVPDVRMNPLLLKPEADTHSQVVLMGQVSEELSRMPWRGRSASVWPQIAAALDALREENDVVVIEGAGSPAEINLHASDIVNMRVALHGNAACLLVTDIDRGGAFAHLYGTWALLPEEERRLFKGFVLNKFRGDASLLAPAPQMLQDLTGVPTVATLPMWWHHGLPEEDGVFDDRSVSAGRVTCTVAVVAYPRISNLDEFQPLKNIPGVRLQWVRSPKELAGLSKDDWIILPGSKATAADLAWLRSQRLDAAISQHAAQGGAVLGICGGLQMLGQELRDPHGIDGNAQGLGLLPVVTEFAQDKTVRHTTATFGPWSTHASGLEAGGLMLPNAQKSAPGPKPTGWGGGTPSVWEPLAGVSASGYEIHHGQTRAVDTSAHAVLPHGLGWCNDAGNVLGVYLHGMFEDPAVLRALFGADAPTLDRVFDGLADYIGTHFAPGFLDSMVR
jgi:adenosylcobyric acid synthase